MYLEQRLNFSGLEVHPFSLDYSGTATLGVFPAACSYLTKVENAVRKEVIKIAERAGISVNGE